LVAKMADCAFVWAALQALLAGATLAVKSDGKDRAKRACRT
jgi:hypothetical protein